MGQIRSTLARDRPVATNSIPDLATLVRRLMHLRCIRPDKGQASAEVPQVWPGVGHSCPSSSKSGPSLTKLWAESAEFGQIRTGIGKVWADLDCIARSRGNVGHPGGGARRPGTARSTERGSGISLRNGPAGWGAWAKHGATHERTPQPRLLVENRGGACERPEVRSGCPEFRSDFGALGSDLGEPWCHGPSKSASFCKSSATRAPDFAQTRTRIVRVGAHFSSDARSELRAATRRLSPRSALQGAQDRADPGLAPGHV